MSSIIIQVVDVAIDKVKTYLQMTVTYKTTYKGQPKVSAKKLTDLYTSPEMWTMLEKAPKGSYFEIGYEKSADGQFNNWTSCKPTDSVPEVATGLSNIAPTSKGAVSWDDKRQRLIVRQSCLSTAAALFGVGTPDDVGLVIAMAKSLEEYVWDYKPKTIEDMDSDIPF